MCVYIIRDTEGNIKIGKSVRPKARICGINYCDATIEEVMAIIDGYTKKEDELHLKFNHHKIYGKNDWFKPGQDLLDYIKSIKGDFKSYKPRRYKISS